LFRPDVAPSPAVNTEKKPSRRVFIEVFSRLATTPAKGQSRGTVQGCTEAVPTSGLVLFVRGFLLKSGQVQGYCPPGKASRARLPLPIVNVENNRAEGMVRTLTGASRQWPLHQCQITSLVVSLIAARGCIPPQRRAASNVLPRLSRRCQRPSERL